ncbi:MAG: amidohydrolase [Clostridiales bacterium]|nr:amidohydrolase [Clostridiales bacterium]
MNIIEQAKALQTTLVKIRRKLHANAETGFDLPQTQKIVWETLEAYGYAPNRVGKGSIIATLGEEKKGDCILLRADMDGLPIEEKTGKTYACKGGNMHACGHDLHTTMLLGSAKLLKEREKELRSPVVFLFQCAEETLQGAKDVVESGILQEYNVKRAVMLHVLTATDLPTGKIVVASEGISAPSADYFTVEVIGKACHGASPQNGVDALSICARILLALETLSAREISTIEPFVLTVGKMSAGVAGNAIADRAVMQGTFRTFDGATRAYIKRRVEEIAKGIAKTFKGSAKVAYPSGCPALKNDGGMSALIGERLKNGIGKDEVYASADLGGNVKKSMGGSEDFAYIAEKVSSVMLALSAGQKKKGYVYPLHHPKADFDESVLYIGALAYVLSALTE